MREREVGAYGRSVMLTFLGFVFYVAYMARTGGETLLLIFIALVTLLVSILFRCISFQAS